MCKSLLCSDTVMISQMQPSSFMPANSDFTNVILTALDTTLWPYKHAFDLFCCIPLKFQTMPTCHAGLRVCPRAEHTSKQAADRHFILKVFSHNMVVLFVAALLTGLKPGDAGRHFLRQNYYDHQDVQTVSSEKILRTRKPCNQLLIDERQPHSI